MGYRSVDTDDYIRPYHITRHLVPSLSIAILLFTNYDCCCIAWKDRSDGSCSYEAERNSAAANRVWCRSESAERGNASSLVNHNNTILTNFIRI